MPEVEEMAARPGGTGELAIGSVEGVSELVVPGPDVVVTAAIGGGFGMAPFAFPAGLPSLLTGQAPC